MFFRKIPLQTVLLNVFEISKNRNNSKTFVVVSLSCKLKYEKQWSKMLVVKFAHFRLSHFGVENHYLVWLQNLLRFQRFLRFLPPLYMHLRVDMLGEEMLVFSGNFAYAVNGWFHVEVNSNTATETWPKSTRKIQWILVVPSHQ